MNPVSPAIRLWPYGFWALAAAGVPTLTGYPLDRLPHDIVAGISQGWVLYFGLLHLLILVLLRGRWYANILAVTAVVTLPVVYGGAAISKVGVWLGLMADHGAAVDIHYVQLCLRMLTVVPLALALVAMLPLDRMERDLLLRAQGITALQKKALMAIRVFNHTAFFVLPTLLEMLREERPFSGQAARWWHGRAVLRLMIHLAVESICASIQYIPIWAYEIDQLPEPPRPGKTRKTA